MGIMSNVAVEPIKMLIALGLSFLVGVTMLMRMGYNLDDTEYVFGVLGSFFGTYLILSIWV
jgi:hypothetical protein